MAKKVIKKGRCYLYTYVEEEQREDLESFAEEDRTSLSALMREILDGYIARRKKKDKKAA